MTYKDKLNDLKSRIKAKFKTIRHFCNSTEMDYTLMNNLFAERISPIKAEFIWKEVEAKLANMPSLKSESEITDEERQYIRAMIYKHYKNVSAFLIENPTYSKSFMSNVLGGRRIRKDLRYQGLIRCIDSMEKEVIENKATEPIKEVETDNFQSL